MILIDNNTQRNNHNDNHKIITILNHNTDDNAYNKNNKNHTDDVNDDNENDNNTMAMLG